MKGLAGTVARIASSSLPAALATAIACTLMLALSIGSAVAQTAPAEPASVTTPAPVQPPAVPPTAVPSTPAQSASPSPMFGLMQGMVGLVVVIALIFAAGWLMKKIGPRARASGLVHVVGGASVGPREKVVVVRFGDRTLLLGVAPGQVSLLDAVDAPYATPHDKAGASPSAAAPATTARFADRLRAAGRNA